MSATNIYIVDSDVRKKVESKHGAICMMAVKNQWMRDEPFVRRVLIIIRDVLGLSNDAKAHYLLSTIYGKVEVREFRDARKGTRDEDGVLLAAHCRETLEMIQQLLDINYVGLRIQYGMAWMSREFPQLFSFVSGFEVDYSHEPVDNTKGVEPAISQEDIDWFSSLQQEFPRLEEGGSVIRC